MLSLITHYVIILSVNRPNVVMLSATMLNVVVLVAPSFYVDLKMLLV